MILLLTYIVSAVVARAVSVGVIDTGITPKAKVFDGRVVKSFDFSGGGTRDRHGHGTMVASIIVENSDKNVIPCNATISRRDHRISLSNSIKCIHATIRAGAREMNMSFGGLFKSRARGRVIDHYSGFGVVFFASHGNRYGGKPSYPGQQKNVCSVKSLNKFGEIARHSSRGKACREELGVRVPAWNTRGRRTYCTGTSCASPLALAKLRGLP